MPRSNSLGTRSNGTSSRSRSAQSSDLAIIDTHRILGSRVVAWHVRYDETHPDGRTLSQVDVMFVGPRSPISFSGRFAQQFLDFVTKHKTLRRATQCGSWFIVEDFINGYNMVPATAQVNPYMKVEMMGQVKDIDLHGSDAIPIANLYNDQTAIKILKASASRLTAQQQQQDSELV